MATQVDAQFFPSQPDQALVDIARNAVEHARRQGVDVVLVDSAGRLHVDADMMREIAQIHAAIQPVETLFVVDATAGQDAVNTARDSTNGCHSPASSLPKPTATRAAARHSMRAITGRPISFSASANNHGTQAFHPERMASRILGMGDVLTLVEEAARAADQEKARVWPPKWPRARFRS